MSVAFAHLKESRDSGCLEQHLLFLSFFGMLVKPSEESGSSQPRSMEIAKQQLFRPKVTQKYLAAAFICSLFIYFKGIWEMQFMMANTERQGNMRKLILFHQQVNEVSCANKKHEDVRVTLQKLSASYGMSGMCRDSLSQRKL